MLDGVTIENPERSPSTRKSSRARHVIEANVQLRDTTASHRLPHWHGFVLRSCEIGDDVKILPYVVAEASVIQSKASVGPFSRLRMNADAGESSHIATLWN